jgi:hypothetical protein
MVKIIMATALAAVITIGVGFVGAALGIITVGNYQR